MTLNKKIAEIVNRDDQQYLNPLHFFKIMEADKNFLLEEIQCLIWHIERLESLRKEVIARRSDKVLVERALSILPLEETS